MFCRIMYNQSKKEVCKYYLEIEKLIKKYHKYIEEHLYSQFGLLKHNRKPKLNTKRCYICYFSQKYLQTGLCYIYKLDKSKIIKSRR